MKTNYFLLAALFVLTLLSSCSSDDDSSSIDTEKPVIDLTASDAFPQNGDTLFFGETFTVKIHLSDNKELGSYSINVHNNFDHHSHTTEIEESHLEAVKEPINPFTFTQDYAIPFGSKSYDIVLPIDLPNGDAAGVYDDGDYHFTISVTDKTGWSTQKGLSIKLKRRA